MSDLLVVPPLRHALMLLAGLGVYLTVVYATACFLDRRRRQ